MVCDDACNKGLSLGLSIHDIPDTKNQNLHNCSSPKKIKKPCLRYDHLFPSLTLGPAEDACEIGPNVNAIEVYREPNKSMSQLQASSSTISVSVKEEKDFVGEDVKRVSLRVSDADEEGSPRKKLKLTSEQAAILEEGYKKHSTINPKQKQALSKQLNLQPRQVEVWFQNRRARTKLKQTEVDRELLKKCCEELQEENKRLQSELQELKSSGLLTPAYMQLPAATLRVCPSCDIKIKDSNNGPSISPYSIGQEHLSCSTYTHLQS